MTRSDTRGRTRRALHEKACAEFAMKRDNPEALVALLRRLADSDVSVWAVARSATRDRPLDEEERAMVAQIVAPHLAYMSSGSILRGEVAR